MRYLSILLIVFFANAGQAAIAGCKNLTKEKAVSAYQILLDHKRGQDISVVDSYCSNCNDKYPHAVVINNLGLKTAGSNYQVTINDNAIETADIYLKGQNLATLIQCETKRAPSNLYQ